MASSCSRALRCLYATHRHQCHVVGSNDPVRVAHEDVLAVSLDEFRVTQQKPGFHQPHNPLPNRKPLEPGPGAPLWAKRRPIKVLHNICGHHPDTNSVLPPGQRPKPFYPVGSEKSCHQAYDAAHKRHGCGCCAGACRPAQCRGPSRSLLKVWRRGVVYRILMVNKQKLRHFALQRTNGRLQHQPQPVQQLQPACVADPIRAPMPAICEPPSLVQGHGSGTSGYPRTCQDVFIRTSRWVPKS